AAGDLDGNPSRHAECVPCGEKTCNAAGLASATQCCLPRRKRAAPASSRPDGFRQCTPDHPFIAETDRHLLHPHLHVLRACADMPVGDPASVGILRVDFTAVLGDVQTLLDLAKAGME